MCEHETLSTNKPLVVLDPVIYNFAITGNAEGPYSLIGYFWERGARLKLI